LCRSHDDLGPKFLHELQNFELEVMPLLEEVLELSPFKQLHPEKAEVSPVFAEAVPGEGERLGVGERGEEVEEGEQEPVVVDLEPLVEGEEQAGGEEEVEGLKVAPEEDLVAGHQLVAVLGHLAAGHPVDSLLLDHVLDQQGNRPPKT
jgi:hypothetical protein